MKPYEKFVENILGAVRSSQGKDPAAATALIQEALQAAGLLKGAASPSPSPSPSPAQDGAAPFVDLNPPPAWTAKARQRATKPDGAGAGKGVGKGAGKIGRAHV